MAAKTMLIPGVCLMGVGIVMFFAAIAWFTAAKKPASRDVEWLGWACCWIWWTPLLGGVVLLVVGVVRLLR